MRHDDAARRRTIRTDLTNAFGSAIVETLWNGGDVDLVALDERESVGDRGKAVSATVQAPTVAPVSFETMRVQLSERVGEVLRTRWPAAARGAPLATWLKLDDAGAVTARVLVCVLHHSGHVPCRGIVRQSPPPG